MKKINKNKIKKYYNKTYLSFVSLFYKRKIIKRYIYNILNFYWVYRKPYNRNIIGFCIRSKNNYYTNMESFSLFHQFKNVKINQILFKNSPFNLFLCLKKSYSDHKMYII